MKRLIKNNIGEIISFLFTIIIFLVVLYMLNIFDNSIVLSDLKAQVYPLLEFIKNGSVSSYDLRLGIGDSFLGIIYYYLMSPFNILYFLINNVNIAFISIITLKSAFSSVFCYKYLKYQCKDENKIMLIICSLLYALSSYYFSYNMVIEFLDVYMIFPLILLGIDKIVKEKKYFLYIISLMLSIISNYYFAYMVCIFSFIYFNYRLFVSKKEKIIKNNFKFIGISVLTCLSMSFVLLPIFLEIGSYSRGMEGLFGGEGFKLLFDLRDIFEHYVIGNLKTISIINPNNFYIYTSIIVFPLIYFYYINNKISIREKIATSIVLLILILSIGINYINYIWHGFGVPCGFNGRFTFMFILFIIMICYRSFINIQKFRLKHYIIIVVGMYFLIACYSIIKFPRLIHISLILNFFFIYLFVVINSLLFKKCEFHIKEYLIGLSILLGVYCLFSLIFRFDIVILLKILGIYLCSLLFHILNNKERNFKLSHFLILFLLMMIPVSIYSITSNIILLEYCTLIVLGLLCCYVILLRFIPKYKWLNIVLALLLIYEIIYNGYGYLYRFSYNEPFDLSYGEVIDYIKSIDEDKFYRIENNDSGLLINSSILYDYYGIDYFMSTIKNDYIKFFSNLGIKNYNTSDNSLLFDGSNNLISSLLGVRYYVDAGVKNKYYEKINDINDYSIYKNNDSLSLGYMVDSKILDYEYSDDELRNINNIYKYMINSNKDVLRKVDVLNNEEYSYSFKNISSKDFYLFVDLKLYGDIPNVYINGELIKNNNYSNMYYINNKYDRNSEVNITVDVSEDISKDFKGINVYYYDHDVYKDSIDILNNNMMSVTSISNNKIEGSINVEDDGILFLSCLYNNDLDVYVDGVKVEKKKVLDTFVGVELEKGKHKITVKYKSELLYISIIPSVVGLILLVLCLKRKALLIL